jgi:S1-C subfamily serine protease
MWHVIGIKLKSGKLVWKYFEHDLNGRDGLKIQFRFISYKPPHFRPITQQIEQAMKENNVTWLDVGSREWVIDTEKLKERFVELENLSWLRGKASVPIDMEAEEKEVFGETRYEGVVACYLTPDIFQFNLQDVYQALWVLECEETVRQGTAFLLEGVGLITCQHVLGSHTHAFRASNYLRKYPVTVIAEDATIDLAIVHIDIPLEKGLDARTAPELEWNERVFVAGFPNFKLGATPHVAEGRIVAFRNVSSITRAMLSTPIVFGMSGGPVLDSYTKVVGVAVTGAGSIESGQLTENHGVIPISAIHHLQKA